jgi:O-antigen ligase
VGFAELPKVIWPRKWVAVGAIAVSAGAGLACRLLASPTYRRGGRGSAAIVRGPRVPERARLGLAELLLLATVALIPYETLTLPHFSSQVTPARLVGFLAFVAVIPRVFNFKMPFRTVPSTTSALLLAFAIFLASASVFAADVRLAAMADLRYVSLLGFYFLVANLFRTERLLALATTVLIATGTVAAVWGITEFYMRRQSLGYDLRRAGPMDDVNAFALLMVIVVAVSSFALLSGGTRLKLLSAAGLPLSIWAIVLTGSRGGVVALLLTMCAVFAVSRRRWIIVGAMVLTLGIAVALGPTYFADRFLHPASGSDPTAATATASRRSTWAYAVQQVASRPIVGIGPGGFELAYENTPSAILFEGPNQGRAVHNTLLNIAADAGVGASLSVLGAGLASFLALRHAARGAHSEQATAIANGLAVALIGFAGGSLFISVQFFKPFWLLLGAGSAFSRVVKEPPP